MKLLFGLAVIGTLTLAGTAQAQDVRKVVSATDGAYPPFAITLPDGSLTGFSVDVVRAVCDVVEEIECEFVKREFSGMIPALQAGNIDMTTLTISEERRKSVNFSTPIFRSPVNYVGAKDLVIDSADPASLDGLKLGVESGSIMECYVDNNLPDVDKTVYQAQTDALQDLSNGRIDILIGEGLQMSSSFLPGHPEFALLGDPLTGSDCFGPGTGVTMKYGNDDLMALINEGIQEIAANGTLKAINDQYFSMDITIVD